MKTDSLNKMYFIPKLSDQAPLMLYEKCFQIGEVKDTSYLERGIPKLGIHSRLSKFCLVHINEQCVIRYVVEPIGRLHGKREVKSLIKMTCIESQSCQQCLFFFFDEAFVGLTDPVPSTHFHNGNNM